VRGDALRGASVWTGSTVPELGGKVIQLCSGTVDVALGDPARSGAVGGFSLAGVDRAGRVRRHRLEMKHREVWLRI